MADKDKKATAKPGSESVFKVVFEHKSFMYPTYLLMIIMFLVITATSIVLEVVLKINYTWLGLFANLLIVIPYYIQKSRRNEFIITNKRFIRNLKHPKKLAIEIPLKEIISVKYLSRAIDKHGIVQIRTTPEYGEQILIDGDTEYGIVTLFKVSDHTGFTTTLSDAIDMAKKGLSFDFSIEEERKKSDSIRGKKETKEQSVAAETVNPVEEIPEIPDTTEIKERDGLRVTPDPSEEASNDKLRENTPAPSSQPPPPPPDENY